MASSCQVLYGWHQPKRATSPKTMSFPRTAHTEDRAVQGKADPGVLSQHRPLQQVIFPPQLPIELAEICGACLSVRPPSGPPPASSPAFPGCCSQALSPRLPLKNPSGNSIQAPRAPRMARRLTFGTEALATADRRVRETTGVDARTARVAIATTRAVFPWETRPLKGRTRFPPEQPLPHFAGGASFAVPQAQEMQGFSSSLSPPLPHPSKDWVLHARPLQRLPPSPAPPLRAASRSGQGSSPLQTSLCSARLLPDCQRAIPGAGAFPCDARLCSPSLLCRRKRCWNHTSPSHLFPPKSLGGVRCCL
uniref:uncharacterized protein LOC118525230 n=1 Tax=Halichoerus grypus TaxID=9711 RepID=UPI001659FB8F|nr:uncharacterized protein LOC118525230 [Halichoerus grypus]